MEWSFSEAYSEGITTTITPLLRRAERRQTGAVRPRCSSVGAKAEPPGEVEASLVPQTQLRALTAGRVSGAERGKPQAGAAGRVSLPTFLPRSKKVGRPPGRDPAMAIHHASKDNFYNTSAA